MLKKWFNYMISWFKSNRFFLKSYFFDLIGYNDKLLMFTLKWLCLYFFFKVVLDLLFFCFKWLFFYYFFFMDKFYLNVINCFKAYEKFFMSSSIFHFFFKFVFKFVDLIFTILSFGKKSSFYKSMMNLSAQKIYFFFFDSFMLFIVKVLDFLFFNSRFLYFLSFFPMVTMVSILVAYYMVFLIVFALSYCLVYLFTQLSYLVYCFKYSKKVLSCWFFFKDFWENKPEVAPMFLSRYESSKLSSYKFSKLFIKDFLSKMKIKFLNKFFLKKIFYLIFKFFYYIAFLVFMVVACLFFLLVFIYDFMMTSINDKNNY